MIIEAHFTQVAVENIMYVTVVTVCARNNNLKYYNVSNKNLQVLNCMKS